jgi:predicted dienelactone hydrolase
LLRTTGYPAAGRALNSTKVKSTVDAPPATTGPYPLVLLIPCLTAPASTYDHWGQHLASYGFASAYDNGGRGTHLLYNRPVNVIHLIDDPDALTASGGKLAGVINTSRVGVRCK